MRFKLTPGKPITKVVITVATFMLACAPMSGILAASGPKHVKTLPAGGVLVPISRSELVVVPRDIGEVIVADPDTADVHVIGSRHIAIIGKKLGHTNIRLFDKENRPIRQFDVIVGYDLPAIRKALHFFLPHEHIYVDLVNANIALTGEVSDASIVDKALRIVNQFINQPIQPTGGASGGGGGTGGGSAASAGPTPYPSGDMPSILNLLKVSSGQQVMLRVRVGEVQRNALKNLGVSLSGLANHGRTIGATQNKLTVFDTQINTGQSNVPVPVTPLGVGGILHNTNDAGFLLGTLTSGGFALSAAIEALETEGLLKILAEPDLVAMSGEKAEFLAGGQFPVLQPGVGVSAGVTTVTYQSYGVAVQFVPYVVAENRIRIAVQPEVSEIDQSGQFNTQEAPALVTRRAKTTVELAPGESFMIAGLMSDRLNSSLNQIPGASSIPVLGALLRSTAYQRNETELVIAVTPYIVDPMKSSDVRLPSDDFRPASVMEQFFYGSLGAMSGAEYKNAQMPSLEGPIGFITD